MKRIILGLLLTLISSVSLAAGSISGVTISSVKPVWNNGALLYFVYFTGGNISGGCGTSTTAFVIDGTTAVGGVYIATVQMFFALGKTVTADGTGSCSLYSSVETLSDITNTN